MKAKDLGIKKAAILFGMVFVVSGIGCGGGGKSGVDAISRDLPKEIEIMHPDAGGEDINVKTDNREIEFYDVKPEVSDTVEATDAVDVKDTLHRDTRESRDEDSQTMDSKDAQAVDNQDSQTEDSKDSQEIETKDSSTVNKYYLTVGHDDTAQHYGYHRTHGYGQLQPNVYDGHDIGAILVNHDSDSIYFYFTPLSQYNDFTKITIDFEGFGPAEFIWKYFGYDSYANKNSALTKFFYEHDGKTIVIDSITPGYQEVNEPDATEVTEGDVHNLDAVDGQAEVDAIQTQDSGDAGTDARGHPIIQVSTISDLQTAVSHANPGDVIELEDGTYTKNVTLKGTGSEIAPITIRSASIGGVVLNAALTVDGDWLTIQGFRFNDCGKNVNNVTINAGTIGVRLTRCIWDGATGSRWIQAGNSSASNRGISAKRIEIDHCDFKNRTSAGRGEHQLIQIWVAGAVGKDGITHLNEYEGDHIHHNYFYNLAYAGEGYEVIQLITYQPAGHYTSGSDTGIIIDYNLFDQANGESECISVKCCGTTIRWNNFVDTRGSVDLRYGKRSKIYNNLFMKKNGTQQGGILIADEGHEVYNNQFIGTYRAGVGFYHADDTSFENAYAEVKDVKVLFNTFVDCYYGINYDVRGTGKSPDTAPTKTIIANNAFLNCSTTIHEGKVASTKTTYEGNLYLGKLGISAVHGMKNINPNLRANADGLFEPVANGNSDGAARGSYPTVTEDLYGAPRGNPKDVGSTEVGSTENTYTILTPDLVGARALTQ